MKTSRHLIILLQVRIFGDLKRELTSLPPPTKIDDFSDILQKKNLRRRFSFILTLYLTMKKRRQQIHQQM